MTFPSTTTWLFTIRAKMAALRRGGASSFESRLNAMYHGSTRLVAARLAPVELPTELPKVACSPPKSATMRA